jgi:hypothetical protein
MQVRKKETLEKGFPDMHTGRIWLGRSEEIFYNSKQNKS